MSRPEGRTSLWQLAKSFLGDPRRCRRPERRIDLFRVFGDRYRTLTAATIRASFEYRFRPQQSIEIAMDQTTGALKAAKAFRTNTAVFALEFVY